MTVEKIFGAYVYDMSRLLKIIHVNFPLLSGRP